MPLRRLRSSCRRRRVRNRPAPVNVADILIADRRRSRPAGDDPAPVEMSAMRAGPQSRVGPSACSFVRHLAHAVAHRPIRERRTQRSRAHRAVSDPFGDDRRPLARLVEHPRGARFPTPGRRRSTSSPTFLKFLRDAAIDVVRELMKDEKDRRRRPTPSVTSWPGWTETRCPKQRHARFSFAAAYRRRPRFQLVAVDAPEMDRWIQFIEDVAETIREPIAVWRGVCIGLFLHPDSTSTEEDRRHAH